MKLSWIPARGLDARFRGHDGFVGFKTHVSDGHSCGSGHPVSTWKQLAFRIDPSLELGSASPSVHSLLNVLRTFRPRSTTPAPLAPPPFVKGEFLATAGSGNLSWFPCTKERKLDRLSSRTRTPSRLHSSQSTISELSCNVVCSTGSQSHDCQRRVLLGSRWKDTAIDHE